MPIRLSVAVRTHIGRVRATNEDAFLFADLEKGTPETRDRVARFDVGSRGALLAVSDGMGGHKAGEVASAMTLETLHRALTEQGPPKSADDSIKGAVERANETVHEAGRRPSLANMGATVTAVLIADGEAHIAEIGDSRAYLLRGGVLRQITEDQSFSQVMVKAGRLSAEEASTSPLRNVLLQAIGTRSSLRVPLATLSLRERDLLILCSDGLTNEVSDDEMREAILAVPTLDMACDRLIELANEHGGADNITVLLAGVSGDVPAWSAGERISDTYRTLVRFGTAKVDVG